MMYHNRFVATIKTNGKVLRENDGEVAIPFGLEYSILLKNMNSVRAQVKVSIDGEDATGWLVMQPNSKLDLERSIKNNNLTKGNKFKFIQRTSNIEDHRGIGAEDGLIRVEYKFEKMYVSPYTIIAPPVTVVHEHHYPAPQYPWSWYITCENINKPTSTLVGDHYTVTTTSDLSGTAYCQSGISGQAQSSAMNCSISNTPTKNSTTRSFSQNQQISACCMNTVENTAGITVPGSESNQTFYSTWDFACDPSEVIVLKLVGTIHNKKVEKPITVDYKQTCISCGRVNRANNKFCSECGTALNIF